MWSMTSRTPGVASATTRIALFSAAVSTIPQSSTTPSWTITLTDQSLAQGSFLSRARTSSRMTESSGAVAIEIFLRMLANAWIRLARLTIPRTFPSLTMGTRLM